MIWSTAKKLWKYSVATLGRLNIWVTAKKLRYYGVIGLNRRNGHYILRYNSRRLYPLVDDKLTTKKLALEHGINVPPLYGTIECEHDIRNLDQILQNTQDFVVKPAQGSGGDGILVVTGKRNNLYRLANGHFMKPEEMNHHLSSTLSGVYSLGGHPDKVILEYRVQFDPLFSQISYEGIPDIRIIVFMGYPVMAMLRLPTRMSHGKANLHQGAVGVGINLISGKTENGVWFNNIIDEHPDTTNPISGLTIPHWDKLLRLAAGCYEMTGLGYIGVDIVLDRDQGPMMLELNARPGLNIQIANQQGLDQRCLKVEQQLKDHKTLSLDERLEFIKSDASTMQ